MKTTEPKVVARVVSRDNARPPTRHFLNRLAKMAPSWDIGIHQQKECAALARNEVLAIARDKEADFCLMIDDDTVPSDDLVNWPTLDLPVIGMLTPTIKEGRVAWNAAQFDGDDTFTTVRTPAYEPDSYFPVFFMGTAVMMIRSDVFNNEDLWPCFEFDNRPDGTRRPYGAEDHYFNRKCWEAGIPTFAATCIARHHTVVDLAEIMMVINNEVVDKGVRPPWLMQSFLHEYSMQDSWPFSPAALSNYCEFASIDRIKIKRTEIQDPEYGFLKDRGVKQTLERP